MIKYIILTGWLLLLAGQSPAQSTLQGISDEEKLSFIRQYVEKHGLDKYGLPDFVLAGIGDHNLYGCHWSPKNSKKYQRSTIELHPAAFATLGELETALRHELMHYWIDQGRIPPELSKAYEELKTQIPERFDFSTVQESLREATVQSVLEIGRQFAEEWVIAKLVLQEVSSYEDPINARTGAESILEPYRRDWGEFWRSPKRLMTPGGEMTISPLESDPTDEETIPNLSGTYECISGGNCKRSGVYTEPVPQGHTSTEISPLTIRQDGQKLSLSSSYRYTISNPSFYTRDVVTTISNQGEGLLSEKVADITWVSTYQSSGAKMTHRAPDGQIISTSEFLPTNHILHARSRIEIFSDRQIQMTTVLDGKTYRTLYERVK